MTIYRHTLWILTLTLVKHNGIVLLSWPSLVGTDHRELNEVLEMCYCIWIEYQGINFRTCFY